MKKHPKRHIDALEMIKKADRYKPVNSGLVSRFSGLSGEGVRELVNSARREGQPICSSRNGYWLARNTDELDETIRELTGRIMGIQAAVDGLKKARLTLEISESEFRL